MRRLDVVLGGLLALLVLAGMWCGVGVFNAVRSSARPDPATFPVARIERMARAAGIRANVDRVLFVDLDVNAAVFIGRVVKLDAALIENGTYREGSRRWGEVRVLRRDDGRTLVSFCAATTRGEWHQARRWFAAEAGRAMR